MSAGNGSFFSPRFMEGVFGGENSPKYVKHPRRQEGRGASRGGIKKGSEVIGRETRWAFVVQLKTVKGKFFVKLGNF